MLCSSSRPPEIYQTYFIVSNPKVPSWNMGISHEDKVIWVFNNRNLWIIVDLDLSLQKKVRLLWIISIPLPRLLMCIICAFICLYSLVSFWTGPIMTKDNIKPEREREREIQIPFLCIHAVVSKSNPACSSVLLLVCVFADWLNWGTLEVTHCIITVLTFYLITTDHYYINELLINYWISIISWSFMHNYNELQLWIMLQMYLSVCVCVCVWVQVHVCVLIRTVGKEQLSTLRLSSSLFHTAVLTTQREGENVTFHPCQLDYIKKYHSSLCVSVHIHTYIHKCSSTIPVCLRDVTCLRISHVASQ